MTARITTSRAFALLLLLLLTACGAPVAGAPASTAPTLPASSPAPATPTLPAGERPPRPVPDPAAIAQGAPLRATLLAQIDAYERELAACTTSGTPAVPCGTGALRALRHRFPEFDAYVTWRDAIWYCVSDGRGGYTRINTTVYHPPTTDELRDPARLDVYVSGTPWCGVAGPH